MTNQKRGKYQWLVTVIVKDRKKMKTLLAFREKEATLKKNSSGRESAMTRLQLNDAD